MRNVLIDNKKCTGCSACFNKCPKRCIQMMEDSEGFNYPVIDEHNCINCGVCLKVCPIDKKRNVGDMTLAYVCQSKEETIWGASFSAGVFSLLAEQIIKTGGVVFGAAFSEEFNVYHIFVEH